MTPEKEREGMEKKVGREEQSHGPDSRLGIWPTILREEGGRCHFPFMKCRKLRDGVRRCNINVRVWVSGCMP